MLTGQLMMRQSIFYKVQLEKVESILSKKIKLSEDLTR